MEKRTIMPIISLIVFNMIDKQAIKAVMLPQIFWSSHASEIGRLVNKLSHLLKRDEHPDRGPTSTRAESWHKASQEKENTMCVTAE